MIINIMNDRNYRRFAIREPKNITQINDIDFWARNTVLKKLN